MDNELLTVQQAAKVLGLKPTTLNKWRHRRAYPLAYVKIGGLVRYRPRDIQAFIESRVRPGVSVEPKKRRTR